jgi:hypothetical protein
LRDQTEEFYLSRVDQEGYDMDEPTLEKQAREYFLNGGGGHEDGECGARAVSYTFDGMVEMAASFAEYMLERVAKVMTCQCNPTCQGTHPWHGPDEIRALMGK